MKITCPQDVFFLSKEIHAKQKEILLVFYLNSLGHILDRVKITSLHEKISFTHAQVFAPTLTNQSQFILLCHNHPSGNLKPSKADLETTQALIKAGKILEITIIDHILVTKKGYYSILKDITVLLPFDHQHHQ